MNCGDICLVSFPFTDASATKMRPVLVVSPDDFNRGQDRVVLPISSVPHPDDPYSLYIPANSPYFDATGLRQSSAVKWTKPFTVSTLVLQRRIGRLDAKLLAEVRTKLAALFA